MFHLEFMPRKEMNLLGLCLRGVALLAQKVKFTPVTAINIENFIFLFLGKQYLKSHRRR